MAKEYNRLEQLVNNAIKGDQSAYKELYLQFSQPMFNVCIRMTGNRQQAEDVIQEVFIKAFANLQQLKEPLLFGGWLRKILINACLQHAKKKTDFQELSPLYDIEEELDVDLDGQKDFARLHNGIKTLPEGCRQIFLLYVTEDYSHKEIAVALNISESTSKSQYARAKQLLRERLIKGNG